MERKTITSTSIREIGYDSDSQLLEITFHRGGSYEYSGVPQDEYDAFMAAESQGKYFHAYIKNKYPTTKIG